MIGILVILILSENKNTVSCSNDESIPHTLVLRKL